MDGPSYDAAADSRARKVEEALSYLDDVRNAFPTGSTYEEFQKLMKAFQTGMYATSYSFYLICGYFERGFEMHMVVCKQALCGLLCLSVDLCTVSAECGRGRALRSVACVHPRTLRRQLHEHLAAAAERREA